MPTWPTSTSCWYLRAAAPLCVRWRSHCRTCSCSPALWQPPGCQRSYSSVQVRRSLPGALGSLAPRRSAQWGRGSCPSQSLPGAHSVRPVQVTLHYPLQPVEVLTLWQRSVVLSKSSPCALLTKVVRHCRANCNVSTALCIQQVRSRTHMHARSSSATMHRVSDTVW
jgi:hypothetical protein